VSGRRGEHRVPRRFRDADDFAVLEQATPPEETRLPSRRLFRKIDPTLCVVCLIAEGTRLYGVGPPFTSTNADCLAYGTNENLSVPDLVSAGRVLNSFHSSLHQCVVNHDFDK
jgi:hypothetical protein